MASFSFHEGLPEGLNFRVDVGIFHHPKHLALQAVAGWHSFYIRKESAVEGLVHFNIHEQEALSPYRSPFGSFIFSDAVDQSVLHDFVSYCEDKLTAQSVRHIALKHWPEVYSPDKSNRLEHVLMASGYQVAGEETSAVISVTEKSFESGLHRSEKKRLRKCRESNLTFDVMPMDQLQKVYIFLESCRKEKGYSLSMSFPEIGQLARAFPDNLLLTTVSDKNQLAAANISVQVYDDVLYNFYHDHSAEYDHVSPVVLLNEGLYRYCQQHQIRLLDLGTSNLGGKLNESLLNFKLRLGARAARKLTFTKNLE